jgi:hypothetical protein
MREKIPKFQLTALEISRSARFVRNHGKVCPKIRDAALEYKFTFAGIGEGVEIICPCGFKKDITDYASW